MEHDTLKQEVSHAETTTHYQVDHQEPPQEEEPKLHLKTFLVLLVRLADPSVQTSCR
jgi:hypothetical protein